MALINTAKEFIKVKNAKVILALRRDLIDRVFRLSRQAGFQEEKFVSLCTSLRWTREQLIDILDRRVAAMVARRYTKQIVCHKDLLPAKFDHVPITDFVSSIITTPRDVIAFFNNCIASATNQTRLGRSELTDAVGSSEARLRALADEWNADYPSLASYAKLLRGRPSTFKLSTIPDSEVENLILSICPCDSVTSGYLEELAMNVVDRDMSVAELQGQTAESLLQTRTSRAKGISARTYDVVRDSDRNVLTAEISEDTSVEIHPKLRSSPEREAPGSSRQKLTSNGD